MKCIVLAGGSGSRLGPATKVLSKQMIPVYDKPMIYYPLSIAMLAGIRDILIISSEDHLPFYKNLFGSGNHIGLHIFYKSQAKPEGIAQAFLLGEDFIGTDSVCLLLGDNILFGHGISDILNHLYKDFTQGAFIFGCEVKDPREYGVLCFNKEKEVVNIEEKPKDPKSVYAVPGIYFYDHTVVEKTKTLKPSARGELEITEINNLYIKEKALKIEILGRGFTWFDTGNPDNLLDASNFVASIERNHNIKIACLEEIAYNQGWIDLKSLNSSIEAYKNSSYGNYLKKIIKPHRIEDI